MATLQPVITFQVNLQTVNALSHLPPDRHRTDQDAVIADLNARSDTRSFILPNGVAYKHGDKFTLSGLEAIRIRDLLTTGDNPMLVECDLGDDINCVADIGGTADVTATATAIATMKAISATVSAGGSGYHPTVSDTLTVSGGTSTTAAIFSISTVASVLSQTAANFNGAGNNGTFAAGTGYANGNTITLSDGTIVTVGTVGGGGEVSTFSITTISTTPHAASGDTLTQSSTSGSGTGFTLTLGTANQGVAAVTVGTAGVYSVLPSNPASTTGAGTGATLTISWGVNAVTVTDGGNNYASAPAVSFTGTGGTGATATAVLDGDEVDSITVNAAGTSFTVTATVVIAAP